MKYNKEDFIKFYSKIFGKDVMQVIGENESYRKKQKKTLNDIDKRINNIREKVSSLKGSSREEAKIELSRLNLIRQSYIVDEVSSEDSEAEIVKQLEELEQLMEKIVYNLIRVEGVK